MRLRFLFLFLCLALPFLTPVASGQQADADFGSRIRAIHSRIQAMGHGYYSKKEWNDLFYDLDVMAEDADRAGKTDQLIEVNLLQAMIYSDMLREYDRAQTLLEATREKYRGSSSPVMRKVYGRLAEVYAKTGNDAAVGRLIQEFKRSPAYDPEFYPFSGGRGPGDPLVLTRPGAGASESITVTAMQKSHERAALAPGNMMPDFSATDRSGTPVSLSDYRGQVVLVDFWGSQWEVWKRELPYLKSIHQRYHPQGFEILGICLDQNADSAGSFLRTQGIPWRQVTGDHDLPRRFNIFGEATNFLLDRNGVIIARDVTGANLVEAIKRSL